MGDVVRAYGSSREDIRALRGSLLETQSVLTAKKSGQVPLKELWLKKAEVEETIRIINEVEKLKVICRAILMLPNSISKLSVIIVM